MAHVATEGRIWPGFKTLDVSGKAGRLHGACVSLSENARRRW